MYSGYELELIAEIDILKQDVWDFEKEVRTLQDELLTVRAVNDALQQVIEEFQNEYMAVKADNIALHQDIQELEAGKQSLDADKDALCQDIRRLKAEKQSAENANKREIRENQAEKRSLNDHFDYLYKQIYELQDEQLDNSALKQNIQELETENLLARAENDALQQEIRGLRLRKLISSENFGNSRLRNDRLKLSSGTCRSSRNM